jgi:two-component system chemotaxis response regulator CheY
MRALVIDDSKAMRSIIGNMLRKAGHEVSEAENGVKGLEYLNRTGPVDLVLVDWNMPEMNGYDFVVAVRSSPAYRAMPIVMVTTETEMCQVVRALEAGADEYVMKPFTRESLLGKLELAEASRR